MTELHDALEATVALNLGELVHWAPGDATVYRVVLVNASSSDRTRHLTALLVAVGTYGVGPYLVIQAPRADYDRWTPETFVRAYGHRYASWWAGVRPLLATLGWTADRDGLAYDPRDADAAARYVADEGSP